MSTICIMNMVGSCCLLYTTITGIVRKRYPKIPFRRTSILVHSCDGPHYPKQSTDDTGKLPEES